MQMFLLFILCCTLNHQGNDNLRYMLRIMYLTIKHSVSNICTVVPLSNDTPQERHPRRYDFISMHRQYLHINDPLITTSP